MDYALLFVIFLLISEITCIVIYLSKYTEIFDLKYNDLTHDIYDSENKKDTEIVLEFERIFGKICKKILCFEPDFREFFTWIFCILMVLFSAIGGLTPLCNSKDSCCRIYSLILLVIAAFMDLYNIDSAFTEDEMYLYGNIYKYDEELNNRIRDALDMIYKRSLYLKPTSIMILIIIVAIFVNSFLIKKKEDKESLQNANIQLNNDMYNNFNNNPYIN